MWGEIFTGTGMWNAVVFAIVLIVVAIIVRLIRSMGIEGAAKREHGGEPYYFGNEVPESAHIRASNLYWGFLKTMERYYRPLVGEHTGNVNDFMAWAVLTMAGILLLMFFM